MFTPLSVKSGLSPTLSMLWTFLAIGLAFASPTLAQNAFPITGTVVTDDGQPIVGVMVQGSVWKSCCPVQQDSATSDEKGEFRLQHGGLVIHFLKDNLQPETIVVKPGTSKVRVTMHRSTDSLSVPICGRPRRGEKQIGQKYGPRFTVSVHSVTVKGGKPDTDYVKYVIRPKRGKSYLEFWFGPYAMPSEPDDEQFTNSSDFSQRNIVVTGGGIGMDSRGHLRGGDSWRQTVIVGHGGAVYVRAPAGEATVFDRIINSICTVPYPSR